MQEHDACSIHIDDESNLFAEALSRMPRVDDIDAYDCDNKIPCTAFCFSMDKEIIRMDNHYTNVCRAMLQTNGLRIVNLDEHSIF